jgi:UV DNA damage endonuclease
MHPDQFTLINSVDEAIFRRSVKELSYHAEVLDLLGLDMSAKIQIHVGGVYADRRESIERFIERYRMLPKAVKSHLVVENDDRCYGVKDCLYISRATGVPVLFDSFHDSVLWSGMPIDEIMKEVAVTWRKEDGIPMVDYSSQQGSARAGAHAFTIDEEGFRKFLNDTMPFDLDIMLEIKDKEKSALKAVSIASTDKRFMK